MVFFLLLIQFKLISSDSGFRGICLPPCLCLELIHVVLKPQEVRNVSSHLPSMTHSHIWMFKWPDVLTPQWAARYFSFVPFIRKRNSSTCLLSQTNNLASLLLCLKQMHRSSTESDHFSQTTWQYDTMFVLNEFIQIIYNTPEVIDISPLLCLCVIFLLLLMFCLYGVFY